jgi:hypothetical protein
MTDRVAAAPPRLERQLAQLAFDLGAPAVLYYSLHGAGAPNLVALSASATLPALGVAYALVVHRRLDGIAAFVMATMLTAVLVSVVASSPRFLLAKDGLITGLWGVWFLASVPARRPAAFLFARPLMEHMPIYAGRNWDALWDHERRFRRIWRASSVMWGLGLLLDAAVRVVISYTLPVHEVPALGGMLYPATFVALQIITNVYYSAAGLHRLLGARWLKRRPGRSMTGAEQPTARPPAL